MKFQYKDILVEYQKSGIYNYYKIFIAFDFNEFYKTFFNV